MKKAEKELSLSGIFYRRRENWIRHVLRLPKDKLSHVEKLVAIYIAETTNPKERSWVTSQGRIATDLGVGIRVVKNSVVKLRKLGLIVTCRVRISANSKLFNSYSIVPVEDAENQE